ncbi:substrate-binding periplasmic protein [Curvivirga aplysinae]|uniref:substrate-binding periplasmic protein n=1 Tax=Curvivirga aplysinae TaxID=2529852 RepID=UPI001C3F5297|nr:transporter substrate-binding domain-containing protein [Curvivirga aplysinae]
MRIAQHGLKIILTILCLLSVGFGLNKTLHAHNSPILVCYSTDHFPPFIVGQGEKIPKNPGIQIELLQKVIEAEKTKFTLIRRPWKRCLKMLETGEVDMIPGASFLESRSKYAKYPRDKTGALDNERKFIKSEYLIFYNIRNNSDLRWDGESLSGVERHIGAELGFSVVTHLMEDGFNILELENTAKGLELLERGRIDAFVSFLNLVNPILEKKDHTIKHFSKPYLSKNYYLIMSNSFYSAHPALSERIWDRIPAVKREMADYLNKKYF